MNRLVQFGFSSPEYGGDFSWGFTLPQYLAITLVLAVLGLAPFYRLKEKVDQTHQSMVAQFQRLFRRFELDACWRVVLFLFLCNFFTSLHNNTFYDVANQWCHVSPWVEGLFGNILANLLFSAGMYGAQTYLLNVNWHKTLRASVILMAAFAYLPAVLIDLGYVRSQFFFAGAPLLNSLAYGVFNIVSCLCAVEIAEKGHEGIMYGFITTVGNLASPLSSLISSNIVTWFHLYDDKHRLLDDDGARRRMLGLDSLIVALNLVAVPCILVLPRQKQDIQVFIFQNEPRWFFFFTFFSFFLFLSINDFLLSFLVFLF